MLGKNSQCPILQASGLLPLFLVLLQVFLHKKYHYNGRPLFCLILFGMKGRESDLLTYLLHFYIHNTVQCNK